MLPLAMVEYCRGFFLVLDFHYNETVYNLTVANTSPSLVDVDG